MIAIFDVRNMIFITAFKNYPDLKKAPETIDMDDALYEIKWKIKAGIEDLCQEWAIDEFYLVLDGKESFRKSFYPGYKSSRHDKPELILETERCFVNEWSEEFGWNIIQQDGMEGDDWMAIITKDKTNDYLLVTGDEDMHQLTIYDNVYVLALVKKQVFGKKYIACPYWVKFTPCDGYKVCYDKIWLGCNSDDVPKLLPKGIGEVKYEKTFTSDWLRKSYEAIIDSTYDKCPFYEIDATDVYRNYTLTCLLHNTHSEILLMNNIVPQKYDHLINRFTGNKFF